MVLSAKKVATLLILSALAAAVATFASAEDGGLRSGGFHGRNLHKRGPSENGVVVGGIILDGYGYGGNANGPADTNGPSNGTGSDSGYGDWYGISSTHRECPLFRKRVLTPGGWQVQMVPVC
jgi:hypothetical protein